MTGTTQRPALAWLLLIVLSVIWGSSFILMLLGLKGFNALQLALIRMSVAAICLSPLLVMYVRKVSWRDVGLLLVIGLTGNAIPAYLFAQSETQLPSAIVGVLNSMSPIFTLLLGWLFFQLRFPLINGVGVMVGFAGATILALSGSDGQDMSGNLSYSLLVVGATICYGISTNLIKHYFSGRNPIMIATMALSLVGWPCLLVLLCFTDFTDQVATNPEAPEALVYIGILGAVGTAFGVALFNQLLQISSIIFATSVTYTIPIVALLWGVFLKEELTISHGIGFAVILVGVWLANRK
jgi:drug/metabolite transporter (DMT)-like permease